MRILQRIRSAARILFLGKATVFDADVAAIGGAVIFQNPAFYGQTTIRVPLGAQIQINGGTISDRNTLLLIQEVGVPEVPMASEEAEAVIEQAKKIAADQPAGSKKVAAAISGTSVPDTELPSPPEEEVVEINEKGEPVPVEPASGDEFTEAT